MKILLITDIHFGEDVSYAKYGDYINTFGSHFESYVPAVRNLIPSHDLVINLGDLIHETETEKDKDEYLKALKFLENGKPVKNVSGNHDLNTFSREQLAGLWGESKLYYSFDLGGYHHVVLDGVRPERSLPHYIDEEQVIWLKEDFAKNKLPVIVYCHCPLDEQSVADNYYFKDRPEKGFITNRKEIREILEKGNVLCVFSGHLHFHNEMEINGIKYITVPSFTENDGKNSPVAHCLSFEINGKVFDYKIVKLDI